MTESFKAHLTAQENNEEQREVYGVARIADAYAKIKNESKAARLLEDLTPGGSEFYNDPQHCFNFVKEQLRSIPSQILPFKKRADELKEQNKLLLEALEDCWKDSINTDCNCQMRPETTMKILEAIEQCRQLAQYKCWDEENEMWRYSTDEDTEFIYRNGKWHVTYLEEINISPNGIEMDVPVLREVEAPEVICL